jgi:hypothetical protein
VDALPSLKAAPVPTSLYIMKWPGDTGTFPDPTTTSPAANHGAQLSSIKTDTGTGVPASSGRSRMINRPNALIAFRLVWRCDGRMCVA